MLGALLIGIGLGLSLSIAAGPVFVMIVNTSLDKGKKQAAFFAAGVWISDAIYAYLTYLGVNWISDLVYSPAYRNKLSFIGALILLVFGIGLIISKETRSKDVKSLRKRDMLKLLMQGYAINTFNPFTIIFWLGISGGIVAHEVSSNLNAGFLYFGLLGTVILMDVLKIILANRVSDLLKSHIIAKIRKVTGIVLLLCSAFLLYESFF